MNPELPDFAQVLFDESLRYVALKGGRGSAKSRSVASALLLRSAAKPLRVLCAREIQRSIKASVKQLLDDEIKRLGLQNFYSSTDSEIRGLNGSLFIFAGIRMNVDSVKSIEGIDLCWLEESQTISANSLKVILPTIRKEGSQLIFTWNPRLPTDPVDQMFSGEKLPPRTKVLHVNYDQNPWFPDVLKEELEYDRATDIDKFNHVWCGGYEQHSEARVFKNWVIEDFETPENVTFRFGCDFGFAVDPTTLVRAYFQDKTIFIDYEAYKLSCEITDTPKLFQTVPEASKWIITADSARPEIISYLRQNGFPQIRGASKGQNSIQDGVKFLQSYKIVVHPRCKHVIDELTHYRFKQDPITNEILPILEDKNNHLIDSLRYAFESLRKSLYKTPTGLLIPSL